MPLGESPSARGSPTKRKGNVAAHVIVHFGPAWVRYRIVNTPRGLCAFPPSNPCPGPGNRTFYRRSAGVDEEIDHELREDVLGAYRDHLGESGHRLPKPVAAPTNTSKPRGLDAVIEAASEACDPKAAKQLMEGITAVLEDDAATLRDRARAAQLLTKVMDLKIRAIRSAASL